MGGASEKNSEKVQFFSSSGIKDFVSQEDAGSGHQEVKVDAGVPPSRLKIPSEEKVDSKAEGEGASTISPLPGKKEENEE